MSKLVRQFMDGEVIKYTGDEAQEFITQVQTTHLPYPVGNLALQIAIADQSLLGHKKTMDKIDQAFGPEI